MSAEPHERPEFANAAEFTVKVTYVVAGGKRHDTARARAGKLAGRLADAAARAAGVVDVTAVAGPSCDGEILWADPVRFARANSGTQGTDGLLDRYLDPEHERAIRSVAAARTSERERSQADLHRRLEVGCRNPLTTRGGTARYCGCVYCRPEDHEGELRAAHDGLIPPTAGWCLCGRPSMTGGRCLGHSTGRVVLLDGDPSALEAVARLFDADPTAGASEPSPLDDVHLGD